ncbi:hypothetical protein [Anditalea andensis]|uniref:Outer membrane protein beta-barrel domain-containing protein n=1 Tax=Anditalea andensis TaxID=1048983 RepID=A0A074LGG4_9BACT|nr:hypothetical protein [Anditalea andensis]KEO72882.1 hypothetical protein EL17_14745 [Anditalea andensis]
MKEQFDKRLVEKIKDSFENHEEPFDTKEWEKFSQAYFNKKKPKSLWVWASVISGVAASLVIGFLIWPSSKDFSDGPYITYDQELPALSDQDIVEEELNENDLFIPKRENAFPEVRKQDRGTSQNFDHHVPNDTDPPIEHDQLQPLEEKSKGVPLNVPRQHHAQNDDGEATRPLHSEFKSVSPSVFKALADLSKEIKEEVDAVRNFDLALAPGSQFLLKKLKISEEVIRRSDPVIQLQIAEAELNGKHSKEIKEEEAQKMINTWTMADLPTLPEDKKRNGNVKLGLVMAPQSTSNTTTGLNLGGGVMSEISLSKRLKLDVGVTYARQSLVPGQSQNVAIVMNNVPVLSSADNFYHAAPMNTNRVAAAALMGTNVITPLNPTYELTFANLDIPINVKYKIIDKTQSGIYLISGLSSMVYLNQSTSETYNLSYAAIGQASAFSSNLVQTFTTEVLPEDGESRVDLGRMVNLSIGYEHKLSGGTFLSVEPFYKLPIGNMTFVDQQFSIGGINLRMNFQFKK